MTFPNCELCKERIEGNFLTISKGIGKGSLYFHEECHHKSTLLAYRSLQNRSEPPDTSKSPPNVLTTWQEQKE